MPFHSRALLICSLWLGLAAMPAHAGETDPLFINLTTDVPHRVAMALRFGGKQAERGHPLTIFLNDKAVMVGSKSGAEQFGDQQRALEALIGKGADVLICPNCMKHYGVEEADLIPGLKIGNPTLTGEALFKDGSQALTW